jgi:hypothetical protein
VIANPNVSLQLEGWLALTAVAMASGAVVFMAIKGRHYHIHWKDEDEEDDG